MTLQWPDARRALHGLQMRDYLIRPLKLRDIIAIKNWRNDQIDVLRQQHKLTAVDQVKYYWRHVEVERRKRFPRQTLFSIEQQKRLVAYGGLVHINWGDAYAEFSFLHSKGEGSIEYEATLQIFLEFICLKLCPLIGISKLVTETYPHRTHHLPLLEKYGFEIDNSINLESESESIFHSLELK